MLSGWIVQELARFRNDDGSETSATWKADTNTHITQYVSSTGTTKFRIRIGLRETNGISYQAFNNFSVSVNGGAYSAMSTTSSPVRLVTSANVTDGQATTDQLGGAVEFVAGTIETDGSFANPPIANQRTEMEFVLEIVGSAVAEGTTIDFQYKNIDDWTFTPRLTVTRTEPATGFTLAAAAGSFAHTGQVANFLKTSIAQADAGAFALTGQAATLTKAAAVTHYTVAGDAGAFALTGSAATLTHALLKAHTFSDDFVTLDAAVWTYSATGVTADGDLVMETYQGYKEVKLNDEYDLVGSHFFIDAHTIPWVTDFEFRFTVRPNSTNDYRYGIYRLGANLHAYAQEGSGDTWSSKASITYDATAHRYWQIREAAGTIYYELSADGVSWTVLHSRATTIAVTNVDMTLFGGTWNTANTNTITYRIGSVNLTATTAYSLTADAGSFAWTGTAAGLLRGALAGADAGAFVWTGQEAILAKTTTGAYSLGALGGAFAWTGQTAAFYRDLLVTGASGAFSLTGSAANMPRAYLTSALAGSYTLFGFTAGLLAFRRSTAEPGTFILTGQAAALSTEASVNAEPGTFLIDGQGTALQFTRIMAGLGGTFVLDGRDANLVPLSNDRIIADSGTFTLTGQAASLVGPSDEPENGGIWVWRRRRRKP